MPRLNRVLIANRGEIAVRVIRTLRETGRTSIAIFSEPDRTALHVLMADEAYPVGAGPSKDSYLNLERVIEVAKRVRADAIHPGYGFFAENATFARACAAAGIVFIGPSPETIDALGDKLMARKAALAAGVPVVPGSPGPVESRDEVKAFAREIGYPLMLKAAAGGGGKGMRVVRSDAELGRAEEPCDQQDRRHRDGLVHQELARGPGSSLDRHRRHPRLVLGFPAPRRTVAAGHGIHGLRHGTTFRPTRGTLPISPGVYSDARRRYVGGAARHMIRPWASLAF